MVETRRSLVRDAAAELHAAGVASASYDAEALVAHVLGVPRARLVLVDQVTTEQADELRALVERRAAREEDAKFPDEIDTPMVTSLALTCGLGCAQTPFPTRPW